MTASLGRFALAFWRHAGRDGYRAGALVAATAALDGVGLVALLPILRIVTASDAGQHGIRLALLRLGAATQAAQLACLIGIFLILSGLQIVIRWHRSALMTRMQFGFTDAQRLDLVKGLAHASWPQLATLDHAKLTNLLTVELQRLGAATHFLIQGTINGALLLIQIAISFYLSPALAALGAGLVAAGALATLWGGRSVRDLGHHTLLANQALLGTTAAILSGLKAAAAQNARHAFVFEYARVQTRLRVTQAAYHRQSARTAARSGMAISLVASIILFCGFAWLHVPTAILMTLLLLFARMAGPARQLFSDIHQLMFALPSFEVMRSYVEEIGGSAGPPRSIAPTSFAIRFSQVAFRHRGRTTGLVRIDLTIEDGQFVGIAGPSGSGKSTLLDLAAGLWKPASGSIQAGGRNLDEPAVRAGWGERLAYVGQDGALFHDTLRANLKLGEQLSAETEIARALAISGGMALLDRLPQGLDTIIGERGALLSGGERQRILLARALLRSPGLLILDEAFSALDAEAESHILAKLAALPDRPTILMVTHREASLRHCDTLVRLEDGRVRQQHRRGPICRHAIQAYGQA